MAEPGPGIDPKICDFVWIINVDAREDARAASIDDVDEQKIWDGQADHDLSHFPRRHSIMPAPRQRSEAAKCMRC